MNARPQARWSAQGARDDAVHRDAGLAARWRAFFETLPEGVRGVDIACGDGAVLKLAPSGVALIGCDLAEEALGQLRRGVPNANAVCTTSEALPFTDGAFDFAVSQYGVDYGGKAAISEAARIVSDRGRLQFVLHYKAGSIWREASARLQELDALESEPGFIASARQFFSLALKTERGRASDVSPASLEVARGDFQSAVKKANEIAVTSSGGLAAHLLNGAKTLFENRASYTLQDILNWLDVMKEECAQGRVRIEAMLKAALDEDGVASLSAQLASEGFSVSLPSIHTLNGQTAPGAWIVEARRA